MAIDTQNGDYNLYASAATIYNKTAAVAGAYALQLDFGDGAKNLHTSGGALTLTLTAASQILGGGPQTVIVAAAALRVRYLTRPIRLTAGQTITITAQSTNSSDTDVDVTVTPQAVTSGDAYTRLGAPIGASIAADLTDLADAVGDAVAAAEAVAAKLPAGGALIGSSTFSSGDLVTGLTGYTTSLVTTIEAALADDAIGPDLKQQIAETILANVPDLEDLTLIAIGQAARDATLGAMLSEWAAADGSIGQRIAAASVLTTADFDDRIAAAALGTEANQTTLAAMVAAIDAPFLRDAVGLTSANLAALLATISDALAAGQFGDDDRANLATILARALLISTGRIDVSAPLSADGALLTLVAGAAYPAALGRAIAFARAPFAGWPLESASITLRIADRRADGATIEVACTLSESEIVAEPTAAQTAALTGRGPGAATYQLLAVWSGESPPADGPVLLAGGQVSVLPLLPAAASI